MVLEKCSLFCLAGSLSILKALDREEQEVFNLTIVAEDHGIPQLSSSQVLCVQVIDVNDEAPVFQRAEFETQVMENQGPGTTVLTVTATDRDQGWFKCTISILYSQDAGAKRSKNKFWIYINLKKNFYVLNRSVIVQEKQVYIFSTNFKFDNSTKY